MLLNGVEVDFDQHKMITNISKSESLIEVMSDLDKKIEVKKLVDAGLDHKIKASNRELEVLQNAITNLAVAIKKSNDYVEEFRKTTDSIKELAETSVQGAKTQIKDIADSVNTNLKIVNAALNEAKPVIEEFSKVIEEADKSAAEMAKEATLWPLLQLIKEGSGSDVEVKTSMMLLLNGFEMWLRAKPVVTSDILDYSEKINQWARDQVPAIGK